MVKKIFVLDTNIILHDHKAIRHFQDNNLVIPIAVVEELDKFKKGNDALAFNARGFMRDLDKITYGKQFGKDGLPLGRNLGLIKIEPNHPFPDDMKDLFRDDIQDHRILSTAIWVRDNHPGTFVALVTKDINLRMKAKAAGMEVQDYLTDKLDEEKLDYTRKEVIDAVLPSDTLQKLSYGPNGELAPSELPAELLGGGHSPKANQLYRFRWTGTKGDASADSVVTARYDADRRSVVLVRSREAYGIRPRNIEQKFALDACLNPKIPLVSLTGGAGTGKTLLALAAALEVEKEYDQIILSRPAVVLGGQDIGFLPGDQKTKMSPYLQPLMDNFNVIREQFSPSSKQALKLEGMLKDEKLLISPLAYIRGRSLGKVFFIIDEAQNLTPHEIKTIITRAGEGTKMVFTGDIFQIDQPYLDQWSNGLSHLVEKMDGQKLFEHVFLCKGERSELSETAARLL